MISARSACRSGSGSMSARRLRTTGRRCGCTRTTPNGSFLARRTLPSSPRWQAATTSGWTAAATTAAHPRRACPHPPGCWRRPTRTARHSNAPRPSRSDRRRSRRRTARSGALRRTRPGRRGRGTGGGRPPARAHRRSRRADAARGADSHAARAGPGDQADRPRARRHPEDGRSLCPAGLRQDRRLNPRRGGRVRHAARPCHHPTREFSR